LNLQNENFAVFWHVIQALRLASHFGTSSFLILPELLKRYLGKEKNYSEENKKDWGVAITYPASPIISIERTIAWSAIRFCASSSSVM
jgi:hypothetical protein